MIKRNILYILFIAFAFSACKKDEYESTQRSFGRGYASTRTGAYNVYKVEEIIYDDFANTVDTFRYKIKELNESVFRDNLDRPALRLVRFRLNTKNQWEIWNSWYAVEDNVSYERIEENKRYVKLSFPLNDEVIWNTNTYNSENSNFVYYDFINQKYKLDTFIFDSAIAVKSDPVASSLRQRQYNEVYAKNVGLVYKNVVSVDINGILKRGFKFKQQLIQHVP